MKKGKWLQVGILTSLCTLFAVDIACLFHGNVRRKNLRFIQKNARGVTQSPIPGSSASYMSVNSITHSRILRILYVSVQSPNSRAVEHRIFPTIHPDPNVFVDPCKLNIHLDVE